MSANRNLLLVLIALGILITKIVIAYNTYGTNDALTFEADIAKLESGGPQELYREGVEPEPGRKQPFSHSPPLIHGLLLLKQLEYKSGLPVRFWLRVCCALADLASLGLLWKIGVRATTALLLMILSPVSLMISGFHVNTDPLAVCAVLSSAYLIQSGRFAWAGTALGIALSIKLLALIFVPALAVAAGIRRSVTIAGVALVCFFGLSLPYSWEFPKTILTSIWAYAGSLKFWGIPGLSLLLGTDGLYLWYQSFGKFVALGVVGLAAILIGRRGNRQNILADCGLSAALFLLLTPGFGVQYIVYLVPWLAVARSSIAAGFYAISGTFLVVFYTWGSRGFPWHLADFFSPRIMPAHVFFFALLTWMATGIVAGEFAGRVRSARGVLPNHSFGSDPLRLARVG